MQHWGKPRGSWNSSFLRTRTSLSYPPNCSKCIFHRTHTNLIDPLVCSKCIFHRTRTGWSYPPTWVRPTKELTMNFNNSVPLAFYISTDSNHGFSTSLTFYPTPCSCAYHSRCTFPMNSMSVSWLVCHNFLNGRKLQFYALIGALAHSYRTLKFSSA